MSYIDTASNINSVKNCFFYNQNSGFLQLLTNYFPRPTDLKKYIYFVETAITKTPIIIFI